MKGGRQEIRKERTYSLQLVFALSVMVLLSVLTLTAAGIIIDREREFLEAEADHRLLAQCRSLASLSAAPLLDEFPEFVLTPLIMDILDENPEIAYAVVVDPAEKVRGAADLRDVDSHFHDQPGLTSKEVNRSLGRGERFRQNTDVVEVSVPILYRDGSNLGHVYLGMRRNHISVVIEEARRSTLRVLSGILVIGLVGTYLLVSRIVRPIHLLIKGSEEIAHGNLDYRIDVKGRTEIGRLARQFNEMTARLTEAQQDLVEKERLNKEIEIARQIEERLLPRPNLAIPGYDLAGYHQPARKVGGDYYDLIPLDDEHVGLTVADVSGKGIPGLVVMAMTSALLRTHGPRYRTPARTLTELNRMLYPSMRRGTFITMFYGILHLPSGKLTFAGAGHNPLIHFRKSSGLQSLMRTTGIPLGLYPEERFTEKIQNQSIVLEPGDGFVQYTDGVNEAVNEEMEEFGIDSLLAIVKRECDQLSKDLVEIVVEQVRDFTDGFPQSDDITLLVLKRGNKKAAVSTTAQVIA